MESVEIVAEGFWKGKRVFITGHTGFKGGWLSMWLAQKGAEITGYALEPPTHPSFFSACRLDGRLHSIIGDIRDLNQFQLAVNKAEPEILIHMAAQALVRLSYEDPLTTYTTNIIGTVNALETVRQCPSLKTVLIITSDKCYENREWYWGYRETDPMGGYDPYACSKGCAELITASYRNSFFPSSGYPEHGVALASARAGNVIGGGDWAQDRLIPDIFKSALAGNEVKIRYPSAVRPWQHVLDPLQGYLCLLEKLHSHGTDFAEGWNFGPANTNCQPVYLILNYLQKQLGNRINWSADEKRHFHEAAYLKLDCSKANQRLNWNSKLDLPTALEWTTDWYLAYERGDDVSLLTEKQIRQYERL